MRRKISTSCCGIERTATRAFRKSANDIAELRADEFRVLSDFVMSCMVAAVANNLWRASGIAGVVEKDVGFGVDCRIVRVDGCASGEERLKGGQEPKLKCCVCCRSTRAGV